MSHTETTTPTPGQTGGRRGGASSPPGPSPGSRSIRERLIVRGLQMCALLTVVGLSLIIVFVFREGLPVLFHPQIRQEAGLAKFFETPIWQPVSNVPKFGLLPLLLGTLKVTGVAMILAVPVSVLAAIYTSEFAPARIRELVKPAVELLAGIPSVVLGFFALVVLATWLHDLMHTGTRLNALNAGVALALASIPTIFSVSEDALRAVPRSYREASLALGTSRWQTAWNVTLPAAGAGVAAAILLGLARCVGETMIVLMASGNASIVSGSIFDSVRTLSATVAAEMGEVVVGSAHYATLFFLGGLLFATTFVINLIAGLFVERTRRKLGAS